MPRRTPLPAQLQRPFSITDARRAGVAYGRTRSKDLDSPFHGIRVPRGEELPAYPERRAVILAQAYAPRLLPGQFFGEATALALHGLPLPRSRLHETALHVCVEPPRTPPRSRGVHGHQFSPASVVVVHGLPASGAVDAWMQCARAMTSDDLVVIGDSLARRASPLATVAQLRSAVSATDGRRGVHRLRAALALIRPGTDSVGETLLRLLIVAAGLPEPVVNYPIYDANGAFLALGDLVYPPSRIVIEYEGAHHFQSEKQLIHDLERHARLADADWRVIRVHKGHLAASRALITRIERALAS